MSREKIVLIGGGGHARVLIDLIRSGGKFDIAGIVDAAHSRGTEVLDVPVLGDDSILASLLEEGVKNACVAVGSTGDNSRRRDIYRNAKSIGFIFPVLVHPKAIVSSEKTEIDSGAQVMAGAAVQTGTRIGENAIVNTSAVVDHDCEVGSSVHICPGAVISGGCSIGDGAFIGAGAVVIHGINIGKSAVVSAGAVVIGDVSDGVIVKGVPAK